MKNLQLLKGIRNFKISERLVGRIPNIKKLSVLYVPDEESSKKPEGYYCLNIVQRLCKLESLEVEWFFLRIRDDSNFLSKLTFPHSLKKLFIRSMSIDVDHLLEKIDSLPHLEKLRISVGTFRTGEWEVVEGQFPRLKYLGVDATDDLKKLITQKGSVIFPYLEQLLLSGSGLEEIPSEIGEIATLKRIQLKRCGALLAKCAKVIVEEQVDMQGELLFHVQVLLKDKNEELLSLAGPYFQVSL